MVYFVYLIASIKYSKTKTYVGYTTNLSKRISKHNSNKGAKSTRGRYWKLVYFEKYRSKKKALKREYIIKKNIKVRNKIKSKYLSTMLL